MNPAFQKLNYWPRYISRLVRVRMEYCGDLQGWRLYTPLNQLHKKEVPFASGAQLPVWRMVDSEPWRTANECSTYAYPHIQWVQYLPNGKRRKAHLNTWSDEDQMIFPGDRVMVLVGQDAGKISTVQRIIKQLRQCTVSGLNYRLNGMKRGDLTIIQRREVPLNINNEVSLLDPVDNQPVSDVQWRYNEAGERVRVIMDSGRVIPLSTIAGRLDDNTVPTTYLTNEELDTVKDDALAVTYVPGLRSFEEEICHEMNLAPAVKQETFWY